jgi:integrase
MARAKTQDGRVRGNIEELPSGARRVRVYAGVDPLTKRPHYLRETIPAGPTASREAKAALTRLVNQVNERRNPRTRATVTQLFERYSELLDVDPSTERGYQAKIRKHIVPLLGHIQVGKLDAEVLDAFHAELRRCGDHCDRKPRTDHRTTRPHECDQRCRPHRCIPLSDSSVRQIHWILSGALKRAVRWRWVAVNPAELVEPPALPRPEPHPPSADQAARLVTEAWKDPDWGTYVWLAMTTGTRRGEMCALQWEHVDLAKHVLAVKRAVAFDDEVGWYIKDTKTHQHRRIALDEDTVELLQLHRERAEERCAQLGVALKPDAFVFSGAADSSSFLIPDSVSQRYERLARRLGIKTVLHALRHYTATELVTAGVDVRTVAGRLGHGGGGTTTLRIYTAWVEESDQRAATTLRGRMPDRTSLTAGQDAAPESDVASPYQRIAADLRDQISDGTLSEGDVFPTLDELCAAYGVAAGTAHRAVAQLRTWGLVTTTRGHRTRVVGSVRPEGR